MDSQQLEQLIKAIRAAHEAGYLEEGRRFEITCCPTCAADTRWDCFVVDGDGIGSYGQARQAHVAIYAAMGGSKDQ